MSFASAELPVALRIQRAAFALTMLVVLAIGGSSLGLLYREIPLEESAHHTSTLRLLGTRLGGDISNDLGNMEALSRSSLVWTALTDSSGREAYLKPFLQERESKAAEHSLLLADYKGRPVAGQLGPEVRQEELSQAIREVLATKRPHFRVQAGSAVLLAAYPVLFPYDQETIGVLVGSLDLGIFFQQTVQNLDEQHAVRLLVNDVEVAHYPSHAPTRYYPVRHPVQIAGHDTPVLSLELYSTSYTWLTPFLTRIIIYAAIACLLSFLVWQVAGRMAVSLTRRLNRLAVACAGVTAGGAFVAPEDDASDEIGVLSRTLQEAIRAHEQIRSQLATLVEERTRALNESLERYLQAFEINSAVKLIVDPDGRILEANKAACTYYGYSHEELLAMRISDINVAPESEIRAEMERALNENRLYLNFRHRLASGEVRDVEVYTGPMTVGGRSCRHSIIHDVTVRRQAEAALRQAEEKYRSVVESIKEVVFQTDADGHWTFLNPAWEEITGFGVGDSIGRDFLDFVHPEDRKRNLELFKPLIERQKDHYRHDIRYLHHDGGFRWIEVFSWPTLDDDGIVTGTAGTLIDITERRAAQERLRLAASVFQHSHDGILLTDANMCIIDVNEAFSRITGYSRKEVLGRNPNILKSGHQGPEFYAQMWTALQEEGYWQGEVWNRRKNGEVYPELVTISAVRNSLGSITHYVGVFADISPIKLHQQQLERIAHYDALTQLPNRVLLADRMRLALTHAKRAGTKVGVCYLDLDGFKAINDIHGHAAGDQFLVDVAARLTRSVRAGDTVARLGGDEFVLLLVELKAVEECEEVLQRLLSAIAEPFFVNGTVVSVSGSIGVSLYPEADEDADTLLRQADQAMYLAKQSGKNRYQLFNPEQDRLLRGRRELIQELERAVEKNELTLHYQPKVNLKTGAVVGMEALLRWQHPTQGLMLPGVFLTDLNNAKLECRIGQWVLETALRQADTWDHQGLCLPVAVNVSAPHLENPDFMSRLGELLARHPRGASLLELEVLEPAALGSIDQVAEVIAQCRDLGLNFALDDFGTGYSSLTSFRRLPANVLKIDISFVRNMLDDPGASAIIEGIMGLARAFGRTVVAEGVETAAQEQALLRLGCEVAQGYAIAYPMPAGEIPDWVAHRPPASLAEEKQCV